MTSEQQICYLRNIDNDQKIELPNNEEILLGRNKLTQIRDSYISKNQGISILNSFLYSIIMLPH